MMMSVLAVALALLPCTSTSSTPGIKTLVIVDAARAGIQGTHSRFFAMLTGTASNPIATATFDPHLYIHVHLDCACVHLRAFALLGSRASDT